MIPASDASLGGARGAHDPREAAAEGALGHCDGARHRPDAAVEPELADAGVLAEIARWNLTRGGKDRESDRKVVPRALLPERCGREVDRDRLLRPLEQGGDDGAPYPMLRLLARPIAHADDREARHLAGEEMRLDIDPSGLQPYDCVRQRACEHTLDATG